jgi:uncharacterized membrane protein
MHMQMKNDSGIKLSFILVLAALVRFLGLGAKQLWLDEILQLLHSRPDSISGIFAAVTQDRGGAPLDYLIQHVFISNLSGAVEWTARVHAAIFGVLSVWLVYLVCRELFANQRLALMSALLFCFYPFHHHYSQEGRPYSLFLLLTLILYLLLFRLLKKNSSLLWITFGVVALLNFYTNAFTAAVLFGQFIFLIYYQVCRRERLTAAWRRYACFVVCGIAATAIYLPWLFYSYFNAKGDAQQPDYHAFFETIKRFGDGSYLLSVVLIICAVAGIYHLVQARRRFELGALLIWILAPLPVILGVLMWRTYFFVPRQLIFITPAFFILVAAGVEFIKQKVKWRYCYPEAIIILISLGVIALHHPDLNGFLAERLPKVFRADTRDDVRAAGKFLNEIVKPGDLVVAPNLTGILPLYFPDLPKYSADARSAQELLQTIPSGSKIIYAAPRFNPDPDRLKSLLAAARTWDEVPFQGITIYLFPKP